MLNMLFLLDESLGVKADQKLFCRPFCRPANLCLVSRVAFQQESCNEAEAGVIIPDEKSFMTFGTLRLLDRAKWVEFSL